MGWIVRTWSKNILLFSGIKFKTTGIENINLGSNYFFRSQS